MPAGVSTPKFVSRPDYSDFLAHFTKDSHPLGLHENPSDERLPGIVNQAAFDRLKNILQGGEIYATPMPWTNRPAVAFTECPWSALLNHAKWYSPYGIGFTKPRIFAADGGPAIYLRPDLFEKQHTISDFHEHLYAFITPFAPGYAPATWRKKNWESKPPVDFAHEREWRVPHNFKFKLSQVQFVIVDKYEDVAKFPKTLKDAIGREKFLIMEVYRQIETYWPTHLAGK